MSRRQTGVLASLFIIFVSSGLCAQGDSLETSSWIDWKAGVLIIQVKRDISDESSPGKARAAFEEYLQREIGSILIGALYDIILDSYRTVKEAVERDTRLLAALVDLGNRAAPSYIHLTTTLDGVTAVYEFDLYPDVLQIFADHSTPFDPPLELDFVPTIEYSGMVIYAKGEFPVHGEDPAHKSPESFRPSLMPKLFDTEMELVAEVGMMDPEYLAEWGTFGYTDTTDYLKHKDRIGVTPLFTMARAVFGDNRTDLLIPVDAAQKILATPANRELIRQGRILIICDISEIPVID